ncbi:MAG: ABC transporter ATP-binding protein, partial [Nitriliruptoraceae bacterium]
MSAPTGTPVGITGLGRSYHTRTGTVAAVDGVDLDLRPGTLLVVVGPSGCGKSTLLRLVAGIEQADTGRIAIGGAVVTDPARGIDVPPQRRRVGMVFQSFSVWPHLDVAENVAYPLRVQRVPRAERRDRVEEALALVGLAGLGRRRAHELSGGQQQRVAIARALMQRPAVLLLDEPLSALDAHLRERLSDEIVDLHRTLDLTTVHVTHDRREALAMADEIAVMVDGRIVQRGTPGELRTAPTHRVTAEILSEATILEGGAGAVTGRGAQEVTTALG